MQKQATFQTKGMQRDLAASAFNSEFSYENKNIRIMSTNESTSLSLINERGNKESSIDGIGNNIIGTPIGQAVINDELVIFSCGDKSDIDTNITATESTISDISTEESAIDIDCPFEDRIYKLWFNAGNLTGKTLFRGDLNFNYKNPIESLVFYENDSIKKVYWTDGLNQPRVINVANTDTSKWDNTSFDFVRTLRLNETVSISRDDINSGMFAPGVIQYAFTYFDKYGQESNIFYTSPLYYISYNDRGGSPEDKVSNSFKIELTNLDNRFDYVRIYSIQRTSIDATADVNIVADIAPSMLDDVSDVYLYSKYVNPDNITIYLRSTDTAEYRVSSYGTSSATDTSKTWSFDLSKYSKLVFEDGTYLSWDSTDGQLLITSDYSSSNVLTSINTNLSTVALHFHKNVYKIVYTDNGLNKSSIDPTELLYVGGEEVVFGTMTQKDNTLFLGDINLTRQLISDDIREYFRGGSIKFTNSKSISSPNPTGTYPYSNQLQLGSKQIKTFKYLEWYRFGIQFQHYTGKWSEPIWINDKQNTSHIDTTFYNNSSLRLPTAEYILNNKEIIKKLIDLGYRRARPVIVYPTINDREVICQGVLCPTLYNVSERFANAPFSVSSWFTRPNAPFDFTKTEYAGDNAWVKFGMPSGAPSIYSRAGVLSLDSKTIDNGTITYELSTVNKGAWAEFRHNYPIPGNTYRNGEIQCIYMPPSNPYVNADSTDIDLANWASNYSEYYYVDQSILTLHSPDIEFDTDVQCIDTTNLKLRIVGIVPLTAFASDIDISTSSAVNAYKGSSSSDNLPEGFYKGPIGVDNDFGNPPALYESNSHFGWRGLINGVFWLDEITGRTTSNTNKTSTGFVVYPWHRNGSLNNTKYADESGYKSALLDKKKMSNLRYSYKTVYMDTDKIWNAYKDVNEYNTGISGVAIFNSDEISLVRIPAQENSGNPDINYYGNVDKLLSITRHGGNEDGYPIVVTGVTSPTSIKNSLFIQDYEVLSSDITDQYKAFDPVRIKYKSTPHAVLALNYTKNSAQRILPTIKDGDGTTTPWDVNYVGGYIDKDSKDHTNKIAFWDRSKKTFTISQDVIDTGITGEVPSIKSLQYGWLWLGELYNDSIVNRFGGQTEEAFENNQWLPCGDHIALTDPSTGVKDSIIIKWTEGDTYYQRYDHIKTYPFTQEDQNQVTDIVSFMCETRVNIDGRYDRNRGQTTNFAITPAVFNKVNNVYSQSNNFFSYRGTNHNKLNLDNFHNSISWTKTKTAGELTDTWTNITLASTLDLDGDKGSVRALRRLNNNIISFQDTGISQILYNENMQIASTEGVPIEIANSGKVSGKRYITDRMGCTNKWSICETPNGIYFIDDITKGIFLFNGQLDNISDKLGFHSWINANSNSTNIWNPVDFNNFVTYYDKVNGDVLFIKNNSCLGFSEPLGQFTSFYSYERVPYFANISDRGISFNTESNGNLYKPWLHNEGEYNMFFNKYQPFYTTIIANPDMQLDKIFNNLEFRSDSWDKEGKLLNTTFDTLTTWNEYQMGEAKLDNLPSRPSPLKRKFRVWRVNIPRDKTNNMDRMRNPWLYLKLSYNKENTNKTILYDMLVHYFE